MKVQGKVGIVTGGAQGLGRAFADILLNKGAMVVIADRNAHVGTNTSEEMTSKYGHGKCTFIQCDVRNKEDLKHVFTRTKETHGYIDIVVNNAGLVNETNRDLTIDTLLKGVIEGTYLASEYMRQDKDGRGGLIINIASVAGLFAIDKIPIYTAAKHGVVGFTKAFGARQEDIIKQGIRVSCICPTTVRSAMTEAFVKSDPASYDRYKQQADMLEISDVVEAFMKIVENDSLNAGVVLVSPAGVEVQYPDTLKGTML